MRKRLKWIDNRADWHAAFAANADKYAEYVGPGFYEKASGTEWGGFAKPFDRGAAAMLGNEPIYKPMIIPDVHAHVSSVTGRVINSRSDQRAEFDRTGTVCWDDDAKKPRGYINEDFCRARGLETSPDAQQFWADKIKGVDDALQGNPKIVNPHKTDPNKLSSKVRNEIVGALESNGL